MLTGMIDITIRNKKGEVKSKHQEQMHSLCYNFIVALYAALHSLTVVQPTTKAKESDGTDEDIYLTQIWQAGSLGDAFQGIIIGSGDAANTIRGYALSSKIVQANMAHAQIIYTNPTIVGSYALFTVSRVFTNQSGGEITVREIGFCDLEAAGSKYMMFVRDVLDTPEVVADTDTCQVTYTFKVENAGMNRNLIGMLWSNFKPEDYNYTDINNQARTRGFSGYGNDYALVSSIGATNRGLVIGTDGSALSLTAYKLGAQVTTGWTYQECLLPANCEYDDVANSAWLTVQRQFLNGTGGQVTIEELGAYSYSANQPLMITRLLTGGVDVPDGYTLLAELTYKVVM